MNMRNRFGRLRMIDRRNGRAGPDKRGQQIDPIEIERVLRALDAPGQSVVRLAAHTGLRPCEQSTLFLRELFDDDHSGRDLAKRRRETGGS